MSIYGPLFVTLIGAALLAGAETKVKLSDAPPAVQTTVKTETGNAKVVGLTREVENGKTVYELETIENGLVRDLIIGADGAVLIVEQQITLAALPAGAKSAIEKQAAGARINKVEKVTEGNKVFYEAAIKRFLRTSEIKVDADGVAVK